MNRYLLPPKYSSSLYMSQTASFPLFPDFTHLAPFPSHPRSPSPLPLPGHKDNEPHTPPTGNSPPSTGHPEHKKQPAHHGPLSIQQRYSLVRDSLVEVVDQNGKSVIVARHHLVNKNQADNEVRPEVIISISLLILLNRQVMLCVPICFQSQNPLLKLSATVCLEIYIQALEGGRRR